MHKRMTAIVSAAVTALVAQHATYAGGFSLYTEASTTAIGTFAAGSAAEAVDASTGWYNPAGLVLLKNPQALVSGIGVLPSTKITGTSTFVSPGLAPYIQSFSNLEGGEDAFVPALHAAMPLGENATFGLSVVAPFGLSTNWSTTSPVRYEATLTKLITADISPEIAGRINEHFSIGGGLDFEWAQVKFNRILGAPTLLQALTFQPDAYDSLSYNQGRSFGMGFHAGVLGQFNDNHTRVGLNYQSRIKHQFNGYSQLTGRLADVLVNDPDASFRSNALFSNAINLPDVVTLSGYQDVTSQFAVLGSVVYTGWETFKTIQLNNVAAFSLGETFPQVLFDFNGPQDYRNTWRFALGANYHLTPQWMMRIGGGYDQTPTVNSARDVRLPDANRYALALGAHYQMTPRLGFDAGYSYLFAEHNAPVNKTDLLESSTYTVNASTKAHAQLVGVQAVLTMDGEIK